MKSIRILIYLSIVAGILITGSCKKDTSISEKSFVCFVETETDYFTRSCFQMNDGSYIIMGTGEQQYPVMARFSERGDLLWQKQLSGTLLNLIKGIPLPSGGFVLAGFDSTSTNSNENGITNIIVYDNDGNAIRATSINSIPSLPNVHNRLDFTLLENGNLAFCLSPELNNFGYPRLLILSQNLVTLFDQVYYASPGVPFKSIFQPHIQEGKDASIYFCYNVSHSPTSSCITTALMKLKAGDYSFDFFKDSMKLGCWERPSSFAIDKNGNCCISTTRQVNPYLTYVLYPRILRGGSNDELYSISREVSVIRTDTSGNYIDRHDYSGFPRLGSLMKIVRTRDGGFILAGTSNQNDAFGPIANTQVFLIKTDANLNKLWMKQFNAIYPSGCFDVFETSDGGYAIGAFEKSFNKSFKLTIIKTDANGN